MLSANYAATPWRVAEAPSAKILECAKRLIAERFHPGSPVLARRRQVESFLRLELAPRDWEAFTALFLDRRNRLIAFEELFRGTINQVCVHPREVVCEVMKHNAASVIFARNEPCGCAVPTCADKATCERLVLALRLIDVPVLDYLVIGEKTSSLKGRRLMYVEAPKVVSATIV